MELTDAQRALVEEHLWLVKCIAHSVMRRVPASVELDDLTQAGHLGLVQAAQKYAEEGQNASFATFARFRVNGAIADYLRSLDSVSRQMRHKITAGEANDFTEVDLAELPKELETRGETPEQAAMAVEFTEQLRSLFEGLSGRERTIIQHYYFHERTMSDIGHELGCKESRVSQMHKNILTKLRTNVTFLERQAAFRFALNSGIMGRLGGAVIALLAIALLPTLPAQSPVDLTPKGCSGNAVQIVATVPFSAGTTTVPVPICVALGPGLVLNTSVTPPRLEATAPVSPGVMPRAVVQKFPIPANLPTDAKATFVLTFTPAPTSAIAVAFRSSRVGGDVVDFVTPGGGANPKTIEVTVPAYRPFTEQDVLTVLYWTLDQP